MPQHVKIYLYATAQVWRTGLEADPNLSYSFLRPSCQSPQNILLGNLIGLKPTCVIFLQPHVATPNAIAYSGSQNDFSFARCRISIPWSPGICNLVYMKIQGCIVMWLNIWKLLLIDWCCFNQLYLHNLWNNHHEPLDLPCLQITLGPSWPLGWCWPCFFDASRVIIRN